MNATTASIGIFSLLLSACTPSEQNIQGQPGPAQGSDDRPPLDETSEDEEDSGLPSEYIYEEGEVSAEPLLSLQEIEKGIEQVLRVTTQTNPDLLLTVYEELRRAEGDDACPYYYYTAEDYGYDYWYAGCTASGGGAFSGYGYSYYYEPYTYASGGVLYERLGWVAMYGAILDRLGEGLEISGDFYNQRYQYPGDPTRYGYAYLIGDARWSSPEAEGTWLAEAYSLNLTYSYAHNYATTGGYYLSLEGSLSGVEGQGVNAALFDGVFFQNEAGGSSCALEPAGTLSVRDAAGEWYHVTFDGPAYASAPVFPPACDGCGEAWYRGEPIGTACPDFSSVTDWSGSPWQ